MILTHVPEFRCVCLLAVKVYNTFKHIAVKLSDIYIYSICKLLYCSRAICIMCTSLRIYAFALRK